ncbi:MAG: bifunctional ornithine acetyltransferase/N-acetylglutamate synthase [Bacteroidales bacterium]|nr:bifunctional ornithine acetyltransferase/N-acetylglutamate synthase [Bacteroidales bacterium]
MKETVDDSFNMIISAAGNAGLPFDYEKIDLYIGSEKKVVKVLEKGNPLDFDTNYIKKLLRESHLRILLDLHSGKANAKGWGTDLTTDYVLFNSVYST